MKKVFIWGFLSMLTIVSHAKNYEILGVETSMRTADGDYKVLDDWEKHNGSIVLTEDKAEFYEEGGTPIKITRTCDYVTKTGEVENGVTYQLKKATYYSKEGGDYWVSHIVYSDGDQMISCYHDLLRIRYMVKLVENQN